MPRRARAGAWEYYSELIYIKLVICKSEDNGRNNLDYRRSSKEYVVFV